MTTRFEEALDTVQNFQGSGFSVDLPDDATDASSYCFVFPNNGDLPPNLTIRCERPPEELDLDEYVKAQRQALEKNMENFDLVNEISSKHDFWTYVISIIEWGPEESRIRQKQMYVYVPGEKPRLFIMIGTDLAANVEQSDELFNQIVRSFKPNDIQAF